MIPSAALGIEAGMSELGKYYPTDISIVGIDDIGLAGAVIPGLTTVCMPIERCGALAVDLLSEDDLGWKCRRHRSALL